MSNNTSHVIIEGKPKELKVIWYDWTVVTVLLEGSPCKVFWEISRLQVPVIVYHKPMRVGEWRHFLSPLNVSTHLVWLP